MGVILFQNSKWQMQPQFRFIFFKIFLIVYKKPNLKKTWPIKLCSKILKQLETPTMVIHLGVMRLTLLHFHTCRFLMNLRTLFQPTSLAMFQF